MNAIQERENEAMISIRLDIPRDMVSSLDEISRSMPFKTSRAAIIREALARIIAQMEPKHAIGK